MSGTTYGTPWIDVTAGLRLRSPLRIHTARPRINASDRNLASQTDIEHTEAHGQLLGADPSLVSDHAMDRGAQQCGTLGSGNHFFEVRHTLHQVLNDKGT